jgi:ferredoxin, 2Fe-2S
MDGRMPQVTFIEFDGKETVTKGEEGASLLEVALANDIGGMVGECGGCLSCATCHVYVDPAWLSKLESVSGDEDAMLDGTYCDRESNSRLGCQIKVTAELDGIVVTLPERQS